MDEIGRRAWETESEGRPRDASEPAYAVTATNADTEFAKVVEIMASGSLGSGSRC